MSNSQGTHRLRTNWDLTPRWITLTTIAAMLSFAGLVFAEPGASTPVIKGGKPSERVMAPELGAEPSGDMTPLSASAALAAPPANDTCAGAIALSLNRTFVGTTIDANDDYQTPETEACYPGVYNQETPARGRDVVFSFTAPAAGNYTFTYASFNPTDQVGTVNQNAVIYLTDCANSGTVNCIQAANNGNHPRGFTTGASSGFSQNGNGGEAIECVPMTSGQTHFLVFDDRAIGKCDPADPVGFGRISNCYHDADCATPGAVCTQVLNGGSRFMVEVKGCDTETEPNDTTATANPFVCGLLGATHVAPGFHCRLGTRAGNVCTRSTFLPQDHPDSRMVCSVSGGRCVVEANLGTSNCPVPGEFCQAAVDPDCDPRCDIGPNAGKSCSTQAFCNPGSDQGATCAGTCQPDSTCVIDATGADTGVSCTPVCVGSAIPAVNGRYCSGLSGCPGGGTCTVTPNPPTPGAVCLAGQTCTRSYNEGDTDFYSLGNVPAGNNVFAAINGMFSNDHDWRMRITTDTQTLMFDDDDGLTRMGQSAPVIGAAIANGQPTYIEVSKTQFRTSTGYMLTASVRPPLAQAQLESETDPTGNDNYYLWPGDIRSINPMENGANNGYIRGTFAYYLDSDCFKLLVNEGDLMDWFTAANPQKTPGPLTLIDIPQPLILDAIPAGISNFAWGGQARKNTNPNVPQPGLRAISPSVTSAHLQWRAQYTGMIEVCVFSSSQFVSQGTPAYPNNWSASLTVNCGPVQASGPGTTTTDVKVEKVVNSVCSEAGCLPFIPGSPVNSGDFVEYLIKVTNLGTEIAQEAYIDDTLDPNLTFISLTVDDGFSGNNTACFSLPTAGTNDAPINCVNASMTPGQVTTYVLTAQVNNCIGAGVQIDNYVVLTQVSTDPNPDNDYSLVSFTTSAPPNDGCQDVACVGGTCFFDLCTEGDHCVAGECVSGAALDCDDENVCTDDSCDPQVGCISDSSGPGNGCDDFNECTNNRCDPVQGCVFEPSPGSPCDDGLTCTNSDTCDGAGSCSGTSVCDDANDCTVDVPYEGPICQCTYYNVPSGTACSDGNACTTDDACDDNAACLGGSPVICNDGSACTTDSCDSVAGCVFAPVVCPPSPDQCHQGVCYHAFGCLYPPVPDGTTCDDGDPTTGGDVCTMGLCSGLPSCDAQPTPKSEGYYTKLCKDGRSRPYGGDELTMEDVVCVRQLTATFGNLNSTGCGDLERCAGICDVFDHDSSNHDSQGPNGKECRKGERELMALALNICRQRVCLSQEVDSRCQGGNQHVLTTVAESLATVDEILYDSDRNKTTCKDGRCLAREINNGKGLHHTSLTLSREGTNKVRLRWESPVFDDGSGEASKYTIWRRVLNDDAVWVKMADTQNLTWVDNNPGTTAWEYEVTFTIDVD